MDKNQIINECLVEMNTSRARAEAIAERAKSQARSIKEYSQLEGKERELTFSVGKKRAEGQDASAEEALLIKVRKQKSEILAKNHIDEKHLSPIYYCKDCKDTGYVNGVMCKCLIEKINARILQECMAADKTLAHFDDFKEDITKDEAHQKTLLKLKKKFESIAKDFPENCPKFMILSGQTGVGKTFLSECLASSLISRGYIATFISAFSMNSVFLSYIKAPINQKTMILSSLIDPDLLVVDDLGTEPILKNVSLEYLYLILSERSHRGKLTLFTTNLDLSQILDRYGERIFSRLANKRDSFNANIIGNDLRLKK